MMPSRLTFTERCGQISSKPLTKEENPQFSPTRLTRNTDAPFILSFKYPLEKGYTFAEMSVKNIKVFQKFLDKVSQMIVQQVDQQFRRKRNDQDTFHGMQVEHYKISDKFRIHVVLENGRYKIIRLDPNHNFNP